MSVRQFSRGEKMDTEIQKELLRYLQGVSASVERAAGFAEEQAPLVAQEIVNWHITSNLCGVIACLLVISVALSGIAWAFLAKSVEEDLRCAVAVPCMIVGLICMIALPFATAAVLKGYFAPRLIIIETINNMVNK
jgi:hypothetical protein